MGIELRMPSITGTEREQLSQIRSYLYQFIPQLEWALNHMDSSAASNYVAQQAPNRKPQQTKPSMDAVVAFDALKPLIIKSADIVQAYYEEISTRLEGLYVAESDFGTFVEKTTLALSQSSEDITQTFRNIQQIDTDIDALNFTLADVNAHIKSGLLFQNNGISVYGLEIGQKTTIDGNEEFNKFARFTADRLSFYDQNSIEVAYISNYKLFISNAEITSSLKIGGFVETVLYNGDVATKWVGGEW